MIGRLRLPSGMGEIAILFSKLSQAQKLPQYKDLTWEVETSPVNPRGSAEFMSLVPGVTVLGQGRHRTVDNLLNALPYDARLSDHLHDWIYPTTDHFLRRGHSLADWLPELPIDYHYPLNIPATAAAAARQRVGAQPYGLIHTSALWRTTITDGWDASPEDWDRVWTLPQWADLTIRLACGTDLPWYFIGAPTDQDLTSSVIHKAALPADRAFYPDTLAETIALIKGATYMVGFPAGPTVLAGVLGTPHCMPFRYEVQRHMAGTFTDPMMLADGRAYLPFFTEAPGTVAFEIMVRLKHHSRNDKLAQSPPVIAGTSRNLSDLFGIFEWLIQRPDWPTAFSERFIPRMLFCEDMEPSSVHSIVIGTLEAGVPVGMVSVVGHAADQTRQLLEPLIHSCSVPIIVNSALSITSPAAQAMRYPRPYTGYSLALVHSWEALSWVYGLMSPLGIMVCTSPVPHINGLPEPSIKLSNGWTVIRK